MPPPNGNNNENTPEKSVVQFVYRFYETVLNRIPDKDGLEYWSCQLLTYKNAGDGIAKGFIFSQEFTMRNLNDYDFLVILYRAFFDREADDGGLNYWLEKMETGYSRAEVLDGFLYSQEFSNLCDKFGIYPVADKLPNYTLDSCPNIDSYVYSILNGDDSYNYEDNSTYIIAGPGEEEGEGGGGGRGTPDKQQGGREDNL